MKKIVKRIFAINLVTISFLCMEITNVVAQNCAVTPTCESMGYTFSESQCEGRTILKCPFDTSKLFCGTISEAINCKTPKVGDILYSDMSCSAEVIEGKTPIGVIFEPDRRLAIALEESRAKWSNGYFDIPELTDKGNDIIDFYGKKNTKIILDYCKDIYTSCPAAEFTYNYQTLGTLVGEWYLPASGELKSIRDNKAKLNETLQALGKTLLSTSGIEAHYWSSTEENFSNATYECAYGYNFSLHGSSFYGHKESNYSVRPVLAF